MEQRTFRGGIHPPYRKEYTSDLPVKELPLPEELVIHLRQHVGAPNEPLVSAGDRVDAGQKIGSSDAFISAPVHASASGTVKAVEDRTDFTGGTVKSVIIQTDPSQPVKWQERRDVTGLDAKEIVNIAKESGLVGLGGAAFPTYVKLSPPEDKPIDTVIINGCECEPFLTCDHRVMLERAEELIAGLKLMMKAVGASRGIIGIEANKQDAVQKMEGMTSSESSLSVAVMEVKYPQGNEKMLIESVTGRRVPPGKLPSEVGTLVQNVGTTVALYDAASTGKPVIERVLTVTGPGVARPANVLVKIGTPIGFIIDQCGGLTGSAGKVIMGGPMTGFAQKELTAPTVKGTGGIVALTMDIMDLDEERRCVGCDKCIDACPMFLMPNLIIKAVMRGKYEEADRLGARDCFECGCCSYVCPASIPHIAYVRKAKAEISAMQKK